MARGTRPMPSWRYRVPKTNRSTPWISSVPIVPSKQPDAGHQEPLGAGFSRQPADAGEGEEQEGEHFGRPELQGGFGQEGGDQHHRDYAHRAADERAEGAHPERRARPPLPGHLVTVNACDDGCGLARDVDEDGGDRSPVHRAVVDPRHHDQGRHHVHADGDRQEERDRGRGPKAGQHADHRPDQGPQEHGEEVSGRERDGESVEQCTNGIQNHS